MCAPTEALLFAEELLMYVARKHGIPFVSKLKVWRFRSELEDRHSRFIGDAVLKIMAETEAERGCMARILSDKIMSVPAFIRSIPVDYEKEFLPMEFLVRCAWICGLCISAFKGTFETFDEALFLIADDLHKIPDPKFVTDRIWEKIEDIAEELIIYDTPFLRVMIHPELSRYLLHPDEF